MDLATRSRIVAVLLGLLALWPAPLNAGMTPEEVKEFEGYKLEADKGKAYAQYNLGVCYANGIGVTKDQVQAVSWYRKAAEQGIAQAQFNLGFSYYEGEGVAKDQVAAVKWYRKAASQGYVPAQFNLFRALLAGEGVARDEVEAVKWLRKAAEQGQDEAQHRLGYYFEGGLGFTIPKDQVEAVKWYRKAAEQGNAMAQLALGVCYYTGEGVLKDEIEAYAFWSLSGISQEDARKNLAILEKQISPDARLLGQRRAKQLQKEIEGRLESAEEIRKAIEKERSKGA